MRRNPSPFARFVQQYHRQHPTLKGPRLMKSAARAYRGERRKNPEVVTSPDEVVLVIPTELIQEMREGEQYEGVPIDETNPRLRHGGLVRTCPACHNPVHIPRGMHSGNCPHCGKRLHLVV